MKLSIFLVSKIYAICCLLWVIKERSVGKTSAFQIDQKSTKHTDFK
jgi:hypothetical protein